MEAYSVVVLLLAAFSFSHMLGYWPYSVGSTPDPGGPIDMQEQIWRGVFLLALVGVAVLYYLGRKAGNKTLETPAPIDHHEKPALSAIETRTYNALKSEFQPLPFDQKLALYLVFHNPPRIHHLDLVMQMQNYGYGKGVNDNVNPILKLTSFVKQDAIGDIEPHPTHHKMIEEFLNEWKKYAI